MILKNNHYYWVKVCRDDTWEPAQFIEATRQMYLIRNGVPRPASGLTILDEIVVPHWNNPGYKVRERLVLEKVI